MVKLALAFVAAFGVSAAITSLPGCIVGDECDCRPTPERPEAQAPLGNLRVTSYDEQGNDAETALAPEAGTLEVTADSVVIQYTQTEATFRVEYDIIGPSGASR